MSVTSHLVVGPTNLQYPKIKLPVFDGNLKNWLSFWCQFEKIDKDQNIGDHDKFLSLSQSMLKGSPADELLRSFPPSGESYKTAINQLKTRYGKEELLIQVYVRELLALVLQKQSKSEKSLWKLYDQLESKLRSLEVFGVTREKYAAMLFPLVESSIPEETLKAWEIYWTINKRSIFHVVPNVEGAEPTTKTDLDTLLEFVEGEVEAEERVNMASQSFVIDTEDSEKRRIPTNDRFQLKQKFGKPSISELLTSPHEKRQCLFCANQHNAWECENVKYWSLNDREAAVARSRCCFLCLRPGHRVINCRRKPCFNCGKKHNALLCRGVAASNEVQNPESKATESVVGDNVLTSQSLHPEVLLQTLVLRIRNGNKDKLVRAIIDTGSERSYITRDIVKYLGIEKCGEIKLEHQLFGGVSSGEKCHSQYKVTLARMDNRFNCKVLCLDQPVICDYFKRIPNGPWMKELNEYGICVNATEYSSLGVSNDVKLLLGADVAGKLFTDNVKCLIEGPVAVESHLGWTFMGKIPKNDIAVTTNSSLSLLLTEASVNQLWSLDVLGITDPSAKKVQAELQRATQDYFLETIRLDVENRFVVSMPWLEDHPPLPTNYDLAYKRLNSIVNRLKSQSIYKEYEQVFNEWMEEGIIEEVKDNCEENVHYLPHPAVIKPNSTTKIRPVFDASAKAKGFLSLNDCLEKGENLIESMPSILMRFRTERIGVVSDIRKAFLQIGLTETDRN
ncbi:uncharacterized protein [Parasteatoda tepidariorum]|uniref:uncharacterized protein n=1 Tax=Parasteatoda tepidariorum TaxID=114398 RepID=UPI001C725AE1|nr:uncharacterized protein LOC107445868 [Parasteatoda tepidariorum]